MLDTLARIPLWQVGLDYRHGTGHGVGSFLFVHEGALFSLPFASCDALSSQQETKRPLTNEWRDFPLQVNRM
jgi:Xaa-Pro aminopeptidase